MTVGTCPSTTSPIPVAAAGSNESISANVARGRRAIAQLICHVRDHRRTHADADAPEQPGRVHKRRRRGKDADRCRDHSGDERGAGDPQPRDAEHADVREQQHGERWAEVVEDGAGQEERRRRQRGASGQGKWRNDCGSAALATQRRPRTTDTYNGINGLLDDVNRRLLAELHREPRVSMSALARRVGMSPPAVTERVQRLERAGVITGYRVDVDPAALGLPVTAFVRVRPAPRQLPKVAERPRSCPR